ncbi:UNVERIFIED_CONTAM: hypothetical protein Sangu_3170900 [Sesamum angustifolium]|uniref:Reverse transcriptase zinc-binding domain-containing protein n=1 Tax=Sesamum angustifolium TaxID=2727405 RepID=A0AAW2JUF9_9LAMI
MFGDHPKPSTHFILAVMSSLGILMAVNSLTQQPITYSGPGPKVGWHSQLLGPFRIPRNCFILWLAIFGRLSTMDKPWLQHLDGHCILCTDGSLETHDHLFFACRFSRYCLTAIRRHIRFQWPYVEWHPGILWATSRWRGKHVVNAAYRSLLASLIYHIWQEWNFRKFQHKIRAPSTIVSLVIEEVKQRILSASLRHSISTQGLYRLLADPLACRGNC